ncbi:hypothetical protein MNBD_NITROSPINAE02-2244 [hydrothermal vent metagenome]|uniref:Glycosyltransferase RgtA/B/C/D-like domain-containing protein n=1 Tax=hydrothermal vent metagenome TaxID=652676 RepID=A0A3B1CXW9_9ZZZZ
MSLSFRWRITILSIFSLAIILRLIHFAQSQGNPLLYSPVLDEVYYINLGKIISSGFLLGEDKAFFMDPLYGYFLGTVFYIFGDNLTVVRLLQIVIDSFNTILIFAIGARLWSKGAGAIAAFLYAIYKVSFFYTLLILKTTLTVHFTLLFMLALIFVAGSRRYYAWIGLGAFVALLTYLRANLLLFAPLAFIFYWFIEKPDIKSLGKHFALFMLGLMTLLSAGAYRNYVVSQEIAFLNTQGGRLLYISNNRENLTGRYNVPSFSRPNPVDSEKDFHIEAEKRSGHRLTQKEASSFWTGEVARFILSDPGAIPVLMFNKLKNTIGNYEIPTNHSFSLSSSFSAILRAPLPTFAFAFAFGSIGLWIGMNRKRELAWAFVPIAMTLITILVFYSSSRLRLPMAPFLLIGAGIGVEALYGWILSRDISRGAIFIVAAALLFACSIIVPAPASGGQDQFFLAKAYWKTGDLPNARGVALSASQKHPEQAKFYNLLGMIDLSANMPKGAARRFMQAIKVEPKMLDAYHNLGLAYLSMSMPEEAVKSLQRAIDLGKRPESLYAIAIAYEKTGRAELAKKSYMEVLAIAPRNSPLRAKAYEKLGKLRDSR